MGVHTCGWVGEWVGLYVYICGRVSMNVRILNLHGCFCSSAIKTPSSTCNHNNKKQQQQQNKKTHAQLDPYFHPRFSLLINMFVTGVHQFHIMGDEELETDFLVRFHPGDEGDEQAVLDQEDDVVLREPARRREASRRDAVYTENLRDFISLRLRGMAQRVGPETFHALVQTVDGALMEQLTRFVEVPSV